MERPASNFDFVDTEFRSLFAPLRRIMSQVRLHAGKTMVIERLDPVADLLEENEDIAVRCPGFSKSVSYRLSFFSKRFLTQRGLKGARNADFIGYAIVKVDMLPSKPAVSRIYESVIRLSRHQNNFIHGAQRWSCVIGKNPFEIEGYLYAQQNDLTNVCAHVALRTAAARFHEEGDMTYRQMNKIAGVDHIKRKVGGGKGLCVAEMGAILETAGARCFRGDFTLSPDKRPGVPFQKYVYGSVESGYPAIICFATTERNSCHAIPVFGHTFNEDTWVPSAELSYFRFKVGPETTYIPSESWLNMYLAHDDNWGSNFCVPRHYLRVRNWCEHIADEAKPCPTESECVAHVIMTLPREVRLDPIRAEVIGADYLFTVWPQMPTAGSAWGTRLRSYAENKMLVLRPVLVDGAAYANHLEKVRDWDGKRVSRALIDVIKKLSTEKLWLVEMSVPELFQANRRKIAEVLLWAEREAGKKRDFKSFVLARLPSHFALYVGGGPSNPRYRFIPSGTASHVELFGCEES